MSARLRLTILGCGSSGGVPRIGGLWGACDPNEPKNRRSRSALLIRRIDDTGTTTILIDTPPDIRSQLLRTGIGTLDAVIYTHAHADHMHGIDDLRVVTFNRRKRLPIWADAPTRQALLMRFNYAFEQPEGSPYAPILDLHAIEGDITITGAGGPIVLRPIPVRHGPITALAFRVEDIAYMPDVSDIPEQAWAQLGQLKCWIVDALRRKPHPTHAHLGKALEWIARAAPQSAVLTHMHNDLDYQTICAETPPHVTAAYDGMDLEFALKPHKD
ncbi:MAG: MBL fold metallo-hydrolase [Rhodobacteraceae bacterium]|nr:MBL fold metallo-hydrolase [Paracoccaceae bacterium]